MRIAKAIAIAHAALILPALSLPAYSQLNDPAKVRTESGLKFTVEAAPEWTDLFKRTSGWFGGDGIFAIPLNGRDNVFATPDTRTMIIFSDTMVGQITDGKLQPGAKMVHNSVAMLDGGEPKKENITFYYSDEKGKTESLFIPKIIDTTQKKDYYWLSDGFVNTELNNDIYIFGIRLYNADVKDEWSFRQRTRDIIKIPAGSKPPFINQVQTVSHTKKNHFGIGIFPNTKASGARKPDGYIYLYGMDSVRNLVAARVKAADFEDAGKWQYWDGKTWNKDMAKVAAITDDMSPELSVSELPDGRYVVVYQTFGMGAITCMKVGDTPVGPFGPAIKLWEAPEAKKENFFVYNAKAHPNLSKPGELLISYNVNAFKFMKTLHKEPDLYRPRFIRVKFVK